MCRGEHIRKLLIILSRRCTCLHTVQRKVAVAVADKVANGSVSTHKYFVLNIRSRDEDSRLRILFELPYRSPGHDP